MPQMTKKLTIEEFIEKAREVHGDKYIYSKVEYVNAKTKVCIICKEHGMFHQLPYNHISGQGCYKCGRSSVKKIMSSNTKEFIEKAKVIHGDKYDYSKVEYVNNKAKVCIICKIHGEFLQEPNSHLHKCECSKCQHQSYKHNKDTFIEKSKKVHGDRYDYSKVEYINCKEKVCIICPKHGEFWQSPDAHFQGKDCPRCKETKLEKEIASLLQNNNIEFEYQKRFDWLGRQSLDFYIPSKKIAIECQGIQHFEAVGIFGGEKGLIDNKKRDKIKKKKCIEHNIKLLYYLDSAKNNEIIKEINE